jgi:RimJ/RimL family protein N-acetyltransferase
LAPTRAQKPWNGWTLRADSWGRGYATEAAQACLDWGFRNLDLDYVTAMIRPGNDPSVRVAQRLGFTVLREDTLWDKPITVYALNHLPPAADFAGRAAISS